MDRFSLFFLGIFVSAWTFGQQNTLNDSLSNHLEEVSILKNKICSQLFDSCAYYNGVCKDAIDLDINVCIVTKYWLTVMHIEKCGPDNIELCDSERVKYTNKITAFYTKYASSPGMGRMAMNLCEPFYSIEPSTEFAVSLSREMNNIHPGWAVYADFKGYYECIKEQYLKAANSN